MNNNKNETHTKVQFGSEIRRFVLTSTNYLNSILRTLFGTNSAFILDEEEDWITISTDHELAYAVEISTSPLRLRVVELYEESSTVESGTCTPSPVEETDEFLVWKGGKGRRGQGFGRGRGQGCRRGQGQGRCQNLSYEDRLTLKSERLSQRIENLKNQTEGDVSSDRNRVLLWRLQKLQEKLEMVEATRQNPADCQFAGHPHPHQPSHPHPHHHDHPHPRGRGGRGRGGRGKCQNAPDAVTGSEVWQCKQNLITARKSGDKQEIASALSALKKAKQDSKGKRSPEKSLLLTTKKEAVIGARKALVASREKGDKADIKACQQVLQQAKLEFNRLNGILTHNEC